MPNGAEQYKPKGAFDGYVVAKLEAITDRLNALPCNETSKRLNKAEIDIANIRGKATVFGMVAGFISGLVSTHILKK